MLLIYIFLCDWQAFEEAGIPCSYVSGGGTGTFPYEAGSGLFTEVQPVSFNNLKNYSL